jgi:hypothetical protein
MKTCNRLLLTNSGMIIPCLSYEKHPNCNVPGVCINRDCSHSNYRSRGVPLAAAVSKIVISTDCPSWLIKKLAACRPLVPVTFKINNAWAKVNN